MIRVIGFAFLVETFSWERFERLQKRDRVLDLDSHFVAFSCLSYYPDWLGFYFLFILSQKKTQRVFLKWWIVGHSIFTLINFVVAVSPILNLLSTNS